MDHCHKFAIILTLRTKIATANIGILPTDVHYLLQRSMAFLIALTRGPIAAPRAASRPVEKAGEARRPEWARRGATDRI
jgi:hypothetical protein